MTKLSKNLKIIDSFHVDIMSMILTDKLIIFVISDD